MLRDADNLWTSIPQPSMQSADLNISGNNSALNKTINNVQSSQILCDTPLRDPLPITPNEFTTEIEKSRANKKEKTGTLY